MQQNTSEWLEERKNHIGSSDAPVIMGVSPYQRSDGLHKTPNVLWKEKVGILPEDSGNFSTEYGKKMEEPARQSYEAFIGTRVSPRVIYHPTIKYMMASLDGISEDNSIMVEIKNTNKKNHEMAKGGKIPSEFWPQLVHQMECEKRDRMHYWSFFGGEGVLVECKLDTEFLEEMLEKEEQFWGFVQTFTAPPLCDKDHITMEIGIPEATRLMEIKETQKKLDEERREIEKNLQSMSDGKRAVFGNVRYSYSLVNGRVKYSSIPELKNVDLDAYRGDPTKRWMASYIKN